MEISAESVQPPAKGPPVRRPGFGVAVDRHKVRSLREQAYLERIDVANQSKLAHLRQFADKHGIPGYPSMDEDEIREALAAKDIALPRHVGISRDCIAKIENGDRVRPKISTLEILIGTLNAELYRRGMETVGIEAVYAEHEEAYADEGES